MHKEEEFLKFLVANLIKNGDKIEINRQEDELGVLLTLKVDESDMGLIIGKNGNTVNSIRTLLKVIGIKEGRRINLKVLD